MTVRCSPSAVLFKYLVLPIVLPTFLFIVVIAALGESLWPTAAIGGAVGLITVSLPNLAAYIPFGVREVTTQGKTITIRYARGRVVKLQRRTVLSTSTLHLVRGTGEIITVATTERRFRIATVGLTLREESILERMLRPLPGNPAVSTLAGELANMPVEVPLVFTPRYDPLIAFGGILFVVMCVVACVLDALDGRVHDYLVVGAVSAGLVGWFLWFRSYRRIRFESTLVVERWFLPRRVIRYDEIVAKRDWGLKTRQGTVRLSGAENGILFGAFVEEARRRGLLHIRYEEPDSTTVDRRLRNATAIAALAIGTILGLLTAFISGVLGLDRSRVIGLAAGVVGSALIWFVLRRWIRLAREGSARSS